MSKSDLSFTMPKTKGDIKKRLTHLYQLRKELRENLTNTRDALKDIDKLVELLTSQLENMEKEIKNENNGNKNRQ